MTSTNYPTNQRQELDDAALVQAAAAGDAHAFSVLVDRHRAHLERLLRAVLNSRFELEDIWQETLLRAYLNLDSLRDPARFGAWLCSIGLNLARTHRSRRLASLVSWDMLADSDHCSTMEALSLENQAIQQEEAARVHAAIADLPPAERNAIMLVYLGELSHKEAAGQLGSTLSAVKVRVHRGRRRLHTALSGEFQATWQKKRALNSVESSNHLIKEDKMIPVDIHDVILKYKVPKRIDDAEPPTVSPTLSETGLHLANMYSAHRIVLLKEQDGERILPIWIGPFEADAIVLQLKERKAKRPLTFDLTKSLLDFGGLEGERVVISRLHETTYYSNIVVRSGDKTGEIDARPSDAMNLALRLGVPIFVSSDLMDEASKPPEEFVPKEGFEYRSALDDGLEMDFNDLYKQFTTLLQEMGWEIEEPEEAESLLRSAEAETSTSD